MFKGQHDAYGWLVCMGHIGYVLPVWLECKGDI
jgi:hypothetical protein